MLVVIFEVVRSLKRELGGLGNLRRRNVPSMEPSSVEVSPFPLKSEEDLEEIEIRLQTDAVYRSNLVSTVNWLKFSVLKHIYV